MIQNHIFEPAHYNWDKEHPNAICMAMLETATVEKDGFSMTAQCGHMREEHEYV